METEKQGDTPSTTLALADPPAVARLRLLFDEVQSRAGDGGKRSYILKSVMDEVLDTIADELDGDQLTGYLLITAQLMKWVATGEADDIPEEFRDRIIELGLQPELKALPAGEPMIAHS